MNKVIKQSLVFIFLILFQSLSFVYAASPIGYWKTIDDKTGNIKSIVKISGSPSNLSARVVKLFPGALTVCEKCKGSLKNKPILGMTVMYGLKQSADDPNEWSNGSIFDPKSGQTYHCTIRVAADGRTMDVRGYMGVSMFGRSQTWIRASGR